MKLINTQRKLFLPVLLLPIWYLIYHNLQPVADWFIDSVLGMTKGEHLTEALRFFVFEFPKVLLLLTLIIFIVGIIRTFFTPESTRKALEGKKTFTGNVMAATLGIVTPFCSCSAIPLFLGFIESGVPLGVTFSFLIAAPMINEVAVILLYGLFGWKVAAIYVGTGLIIAISAGWIIGLLKLEKWVEPWVYQTQMGESGIEEEQLTFAKRIHLGYGAVKEIVGKEGRLVIFIDDLAVCRRSKYFYNGRSNLGTKWPLISANQAQSGVRQGLQPSNLGQQAR